MALKPTERIRRRWLTRVVIPGTSIALLLLAAALTYRYYTRPDRLKAFVEQILRTTVGSAARIESAEFTWSEGLRIHGLALTSPDDSDSSTSPKPGTLARPAVVLPELQVRLSPWRLLYGQTRINGILLLAPTIYVARDAASGSVNVAPIFRSISFPASHASAASPPTIEVQNARVLVARCNGSAVDMIEDITLNVRARPRREDSSILDLVWETVSAPSSRGQATLDLQSSTLINVNGGLPWMSLEAVAIGVGTEVAAAGTWSDLLGLSGRVRAVDYHFTADTRGRLDSSALIELKNASLAIPINEAERQLDPASRYLRFDAVNGNVELRARRVEARFDARLHDADVKIVATFTGVSNQLQSLGDVEVDATVRVEGLTLPRREDDAPDAERRIVRHWPQLVHFYNEFDPHGRADLEGEFRIRPGNPPDVEVRRFTMISRGGDARQEDFPYRVREIQGALDYGPEGFHLRDLCGRHGESRVCVSGTVGGVTRCAPIDLLISGQDIAIDDDLAAAFPDWFQKIRDELSPVGTVDFTVQARRFPCEDYRPAPWDWTASIELNEVSAMHREFPYPLNRLTGSIEAGSRRIRLDQIRGFADDSPILVAGAFEIRKAGIEEFQLYLELLDLPIDNDLMCVAGDEVAAALRSWNPQGTIDLFAAINRKPGDPYLEHSALVRLNGIFVRPEKFPIDVHDLYGTLHLKDDFIRLDGLIGRTAGGSIDAGGTLPTHGKWGAVDLWIHGHDLVLDDDVRRAVPPSIRKNLADLELLGTASVDLNVSGRVEPSDDNLTFQTTLFLNGVEIRHAALPIPLTEVRGVIRVDHDGAESQGLTARLGTSYGRGRFDFSRDPSAVGLDAQGEVLQIRLEEDVGNILPERVRRSWAHLAPKGRADLRISKLQFRRADGAGHSTLQLAAEINLTDTDLHGDFEAGRIRGHVGLEGWLVDSGRNTRLGGTISLESLEVSEREIGPVFSPWTFVADEHAAGKLSIGPLAGQMYDGSLAGNAEFTFRPDATNYTYSLMGHRIHLESLLNASAARRASVLESVEAPGTVNAYLQVSGTAGVPDSRRGVGSVQILDGYLYKLPLLVAVLNVVNLSIPQRDYFNDAHADFYLSGNTIRIEDFALESREIALVGAGTMSLPDYTVDLKLVNLRPIRWARLPILEDVVSGVSRNLIELHVTGPLARPSVRALPLGQLTDELRSLFQKRKSKRIQPLEP